MHFCETSTKMLKSCKWLRKWDIPNKKLYSRIKFIPSLKWKVFVFYQNLHYFTLVHLVLYIRAYLGSFYLELNKSNITMAYTFYKKIAIALTASILIESLALVAFNASMVLSDCIF